MMDKTEAHLAAAAAWNLAAAASRIARTLDTNAAVVEEAEATEAAIEASARAQAIAPDEESADAAAEAADVPSDQSTGRDDAEQASYAAARAHTAAASR
jgi:hypothetical protein